jgi:hypothetical protein
LTKIDGCGDEDENKRGKQRKKKLLDNGSSLDSVDIQDPTVGNGEQVNMWDDNWLPHQNGFEVWSRKQVGNDLSWLKISLTLPLTTGILPSYTSFSSLLKPTKSAKSLY